MLRCLHDTFQLLPISPTTSRGDMGQSPPGAGDRDLNFHRFEVPASGSYGCSRDVQEIIKVFENPARRASNGFELAISEPNHFQKQPPISKTGDLSLAKGPRLVVDWRL